METDSAEGIRLRITATIGRDAMMISSADKQRHLDCISPVAFYAGELFLSFVLKAAEAFWDKLQEEGAKKIVDETWEKVAGTLEALRAPHAATSDAAQLKTIGDVSSGLGRLGREVEKSYLETFVAAGRAAIEARLIEDHLPEGKAKRIAAAVAQEVERKFSES